MDGEDGGGRLLGLVRGQFIAKYGRERRTDRAFEFGDQSSSAWAEVNGHHALAIMNWIYHSSSVRMERNGFVMENVGR